MPEEFDDDQEGLDKPPPFFPYEDANALEGQESLGEPVEVSVEGVFAAANNGNVQRFVLLSDGDRKVPILIGEFEAAAILYSLDGATPDRPMTHDLLKTVIERLGGSVEKVVIDDLWSTTFYAKMHVNCGSETVAIDARPSDSIAIALRCEAPIFVADGILQQGMDQ